MNAIGYIRVSGEDQVKHGYSLAEQRESKDYADENELDLMAIYEDRGVSGTLEDREGLAEFLEAVDRGEAEVIIIRCLDQLARNLLYQETILADLKAKGVQVIRMDLP